MYQIVLTSEFIRLLEKSTHPGRSSVELSEAPTPCTTPAPAPRGATAPGRRSLLRLAILSVARQLGAL